MLVLNISWENWKEQIGVGLKKKKKKVCLEAGPNRIMNNDIDQRDRWASAGPNVLNPFSLTRLDITLEPTMD